MKRTEIPRKTPMNRAPLTLPAEPKPAKGPKPKKCALRSCRQPFTPPEPWVTWCCPDCGAALALERLAKQKAKQQRQERAQDRQRKQAMKIRQDWVKEAQAELNKWVRLVRDAGKPCISCGRHHQGQTHAGHYLSRGAHPNLALVEMNVHLQCAPCNTHLSGNQVNFRRGLIERYDVELVESLESDNMPRKYSIDELRAIKEHYQRLVREMKKGE